MFFKELTDTILHYWKIGEETDEKIKKYQNIFFNNDYQQYVPSNPSERLNHGCF